MTKLKKVKIWSSSKADQNFSKHIRARDKVCFFGCGRPAIQNSHFWGRNISATRYNELNCDGVCGHCHLKHEGNKAGLYRDLKIKQLGQKVYDELRKLAFQSRITRREAILALMKLLGAG